MKRWRSAVAGLLSAALLLAGCGAEDHVATGVIVDVTGDLATIDEFVLRLPDGSDQVVRPAQGVRFHGGASIGHLRDHLRTANPVRIRYEILDDGIWVAHEVEDD